MDEFHSYLAYKSLKLHFNNIDYSYVKFAGKLRNANSIAAKQKYLNDNSHRHFFKQLSTYDDPKSLLIYSFLHNPNAFIVDVINKDNYNSCINWKKSFGSLAYNFNKHLEYFDTIQEITKPDEFPKLLQLFIQEKVTAETVAILNSLTKCVERWSELDHPIVQKYWLRLHKYSELLSFDRERFKNIIIQQYKNNTDK